MPSIIKINRHIEIAELRMAMRIKPAIGIQIKIADRIPIATPPIRSVKNSTSP